jgi:NitT/TauT family transport system substrate-binding protein
VTRRRRSPWLVSTLLAAGLAALAVTAPAQAPEKISLRLGFTLSGVRLPYVAALQKGYYKAEGLDVDIKEGQGGLTTAQLVATGNATIGDLGVGTVVPMRDKGLNLKMIAVYGQRFDYAILAWKTKGVVTPRDLAGKSLGMSPGESPVQFLPAFFAAVGVDDASVRRIPLEPNVKFTTFRAERVDAITVLTTSLPPPYFEAREQTSLFLFGDHGLKLLGNGLVVSEPTLRERPEPLRRFLRATERATRDCLADPAECARLARQWKELANPDLLVKQWQMHVPLLQNERVRGKPLGWASPEDWAESLETLRRVGLLKTPTTMQDVYTAELLPPS